MKKLNIHNRIAGALVMMLTLLSITAATAQPVKQSTIVFEKTEHNFGTVKQNSDVSYVFTFTNTGTEPLVISEVTRACGCTTPEWSNKPVLPGEKGIVTVKYDSKRVGPFNKSITVKSNDPEHPEIVIRISGNIEEVQGGGAPVKTGGSGPVEKTN